jgi:hypothetical protein
MPEDLLDRLFGELASAELPVPAPSRVVARGKQRRRRARGGAASAAVAACALIAVGASQLTGSRLSEQPVQHDHHSVPAPAVCRAVPDAVFAAELRYVLPISHQAGVWPLAVSADGSVVYAQTTVRGFHGIAAERLATGAILTKIKALPASYTGAQGGLGPGGDVIWSSTYSTHGGQGNPATAPVQLWSPRTGRTTTLEPAGQHGGPLSAPVIFPATHDFAAWEEADGDKQVIVEADLASGATVVIATGYFGPPVFADSALVWPVASRPDGPASSLAARDAASFPARQPVPVPLQLRAAGQSSLMGSSAAGSWSVPVPLIASDGQVTAFFSQSLTKLFYSPSPSQPARLVLQLHGGETFAAGPPAVGAGYLGWTINGDASYLASAASLAAARITTFGEEFSAGTRVFVMGWSGSKKLPARNPFHLFNGSVVNTLKCAGPAKPANR